MKAKTKCPLCRKIVYETCYGCITGGTLVSHGCAADQDDKGHYDEDGIPIIQEDIKWEIIEE